MVQMLAEPAIKQRFEVLGVESASSTPQELAALMQDEIKLWTPIIKAANIKGE
jgi:tripartite-type tricarboxylate transporter receptor subunit TctC